MSTLEVMVTKSVTVATVVAFGVLVGVVVTLARRQAETTARVATLSDDMRDMQLEMRVRAKVKNWLRSEDSNTLNRLTTIAESEEWEDRPQPTVRSTSARRNGSETVE